MATLYTCPAEPWAGVDGTSGESSCTASPGQVSSRSDRSSDHTSDPGRNDVDLRGLNCWLPKAQEVYNLHFAAHRLLSAPVPAPGLAADEVSPAPDTRPTEAGTRVQALPSSVLSPWLQRHPILGPVLSRLEVEPESGLEECEVATPSTRKGMASRSPSHRAELSEKGTDGGGIRPVDEEILKLLNDLLKAQQAPPQVEPSGSAALDAARRAADAAEKAAQTVRQQARKQHLMFNSFMALGVKDERLLLLDCFLAWSQCHKLRPQQATSVRDATAQASEDERPPFLFSEDLQVPSRRCAGVGSVPPVLPNHTIRALAGEEVFLEANGSLRGASLLLSQRPPKATRDFLQSYDICLPWMDLQQRRSSTEHSIQTSPRGDASPRRGKPASESLAKEDDLTPRQVLRQIAGLQKEMSEMESSLECLRHEMEAEPEPEEVEGPGLPSPRRPVKAARPHRSRLRQRLPESLAWLEEVAREPRRCRVVFPASRTAKAQSVR